MPPQAVNTRRASAAGITEILRFIMPDEPVIAAVSCMDAAFGAPDFTLPENIREIQAEAFAGAAMGVVAVPAGCVSIGDGVFRNCENLHKISVPENCALGDDVFAGCGLVYVYGVSGSYADAYCQTHENCFFIPMK